MYTRPQINIHKGTRAYEHSGATSPCPWPSPSLLACVTALSSYPSVAWAWLRVWPGGPSPRAGSGWARLLRTRYNSWISLQALDRVIDGSTGKVYSFPSLGQVLHPQLTLQLEPSGSPKRGAHDVQKWGRLGQSEPLCTSPAADSWARP